MKIALRDRPPCGAQPQPFSGEILLIFYIFTLIFVAFNLNLLIFSLLC